EEVFGGGLQVQTTIDLGLQEVARAAISEWLTDAEGPSAALVAIDPRDGSVKAMVGGNNYRESQFNLAVQAERQPGSAFKPFALAAALRQGIAPATRFESRKLEINLGDRYWVVNNYEHAYLGSVDLEQATIYSDNAAYAQLTQLVGAGAVADTAKRLGVQSRLRAFYSIGLGTESVNPLEMARAYATFANGGRRIDVSLRNSNQPRAIVSVADASGETILDNRPRGVEVLSPHQAATVNAILQKVVTQGTGVRARLDDRPAAGKTGTTENYGDAWFVGYTPQLAVAVWVGYPTTLKPMLTEFEGEPVSGATFPALIWKTFTEQALEHMGSEPEPFAAPQWIDLQPKLVARRGQRLLLDNGQCEGRIEVVYYSGRGPTQVADCRPDEVEVPDVRGQLARDAEEALGRQPLTAELVYRPAEPLERANVVVDQRPRQGYASSFDRVVLVVAKPQHGVIPNLVGKPLADAQAKLEKLKLQPEVSYADDGSPGVVLQQSPDPGLASAPGVTVRLVVGR
ncbi:MAG TPA: penicillin-binding transpeptidase domain-containing protein, partial [Gaiellaceae bacterium]|nr:penicillin-binding transpeptidase domain-containing protein [Gaiellaceae bacterium]